MAVLKNVKVLFSNVLNEDDFSNKYQIVVSLTEDQAADAEAANLKIKTKEYDGKTQYQATFKSKYRPRIVGNVASQDFDLQGSEIGRGSVISVQYKYRDWVSPTKTQGTSQDLIAVQVIDLKSQGNMEFEDAGDFGGDDEFSPSGSDYE